VTSWNYQACTQLIIEPITSDGFGFYPEQDSQIKELEASCARMFGVESRPDDLIISLGRGADWKHVSNVVFMENSKDVRVPSFAAILLFRPHCSFPSQPWHVGTNSLPAVGGINGSVIRRVAVGGAHHQELRFSSEWDAPEVHAARAIERSAVQQWLLMT
jgi:dipeptidyl-peptidase-2